MGDLKTKKKGEDEKKLAMWQRPREANPQQVEVAFLCDLLTPQAVPDKSAKCISMFSGGPHDFHQFFQNARRGRARVGALAWGRVVVVAAVVVVVVVVAVVFSRTSTFQPLDKPWSQASSLLPPGSCLQFLSRIGFSTPTARRFYHRVLLTHALALSASQFVHKKKSPSEFLPVCTRRGSNSRN